jgi:hypothetical protein
MDPRKIILFLLLFICFSGLGQVTPALRIAIQETRINSDLTRVGLQFLGKPYRANALSDSNPEILVADLESFDCVTFIENSLALAHSAGDESLYRKALVHFRYAGDSVQYEKRYHYFSDAMRQLGYTILGTKDLLHKSPKSFSFLSNYLASKEKGEINLTLLRARENELAQKDFYYTPNVLVDRLLPLLKSGDLVGLVSKNSAIDFLHTGMIFRKDRKVYLLHASQEFKRVTVSKQTLSEYLKTHRQFIGVSAFRPIFKE